MKPMQAAVHALLAISFVPFSQAGPCPMAQNQGAPPDDAIHSGLQKTSLRRRMTALSENPDTKEKLKSIIDNRKNRALQEGCITSQSYDDIDADVASLAAAFPDNESRSHFLGGIVRLAAHDFLDYNINDNSYGPDGCIDFSNPSNAGLDTIWCNGCDLTQVYINNYSHISKADFWVAAANAVIRQTSNDGLNLKNSFVWGRVDQASCLDSAARLPGGTSCSDVEDVFLNRLGLSYTDAVALIGAHTLGRGDANFSGHHGIWVDTVEESLVFNKRFYEEIFRRAWVPRNMGTDTQDWTWGGPNGASPRFMLNTDMCLLYNIEENFPCCSRTDRFRNDGTNACDGLSEAPCSTYDDLSPRKDAADAVNLFATGGGNNIGSANNGPFYEAFEDAWVKATTNGHEGLRQLGPNCDVITPSPTAFPTASPTASPIASGTCTDVPSFIDDKGRERDCPWVVAGGVNKCVKFAHLCPVTCDECECLLNNRVCTSGDDCCSGECGDDNKCACLRKGISCSVDHVCCSGICQVDGTCAEGTGTGGPLFP